MLHLLRRHNLKAVDTTDASPKAEGGDKHSFEVPSPTVGDVRAAHNWSVADVEIPHIPCIILRVGKAGAGMEDFVVGV